MRSRSGWVKTKEVILYDQLVIGSHAKQQKRDSERERERGKERELGEWFESWRQDGTDRAASLSHFLAKIVDP